MRQSGLFDQEHMAYYERADVKIIYFQQFNDFLLVKIGSYLNKADSFNYSTHIVSMTSIYTSTCLFLLYTILYGTKR